MKRAVILHGTDSSPDVNWFPWLKAKLEAAGYQVWVPQLPECHTPNRQVYGDFLFASGWDFTDNIIIGHSSGAVEVLNLLVDARMPHIKLGVMISAWPGGVPNGYDDGSVFDNLFPSEGFNYEHIKSKASKLLFLHGSDDPYCPLAATHVLAQELNAPLTVVPNGHHLGSKYTELPELWQIIEPHL